MCQGVRSSLGRSTFSFNLVTVRLVLGLEAEIFMSRTEKHLASNDISLYERREEAEFNSPDLDPVLVVVTS